MPHTLLLRLPAPGQEDTEWLSIDETGMPTTAKQRGPLSLAAAVGALCQGRGRSRRRRRFSWPNRSCLPAAESSSRGSVPFALEEQLTEDIDQLCFRGRPARSDGPHTRRRGLAQRAAGLDRAAHRRRHRAGRDLRGHLAGPGESGADGAVAGEGAPRRAPSRHAAVCGGADAGQRGAGRRRRDSGPARGELDAEGAGERHPVCDPRGLGAGAGRVRGARGAVRLAQDPAARRTVRCPGWRAISRPPTRSICCRANSPAPPTTARGGANGAPRRCWRSACSRAHLAAEALQIHRANHETTALDSEIAQIFAQDHAQRENATIRAVRCSHGSTAFAAPVRDRNTSCARCRA